ncbi:hypothetical protein AX16_000423 [Volvariella volvacea WC 439]|nr:hypothetical protein AX16_000423 [Volvariella volvacea WC 439]
MASIATSRPLSHLPSPPADQPSSLQRAPSLVKSHYRPFSALYSSLPPLPLPTSSSAHKPRPGNLSRHRSYTALHALSNMGIGIKDLGKAKEHDGHPGQSSLHPPQALRAAGILIDPPEPGPILQRNSRPKMLKKRSLASLLSADRPRSPASPLLSTESLRTSPLGSPQSEHFVILDKARGNSLPDEDQKFIQKDTLLDRCGMLLHPYSSDATYMQGYNPVQLDNDRYTNLLLTRLNPHGTPSFHDYGRTPPATVLDLGCGPGHWILDASKAWQQSLITGFDLVNVTLPALEERPNVSFVTGNFLKYKLPFPSDCFEMVRMANLSLCIPKDKWDFVLAEVMRVLAPGGRLELIDDQIIFPYNDHPTPIPTPDPAERGTRSRTVSGAATEDIDAFLSEALWTDDDVTLEGDGGDDSSSTIFDSASSSTSSRHIARTEPPSPLLSFSRIPSTGLAASPNVKLMPPALLTPAQAAPVSRPARTPSNASQGISRSKSAASRRGHKSTPSCSSTASTDWDLSWDSQATTSRELETIFTTMLEKKYGILAMPCDFLMDKMKSLFGKPATHKLHSFHLKLAPQGASSHAILIASDTRNFAPASSKASASAKSSFEAAVVADMESGLLLSSYLTPPSTSPSSASKKTWKHLGSVKKQKLEPPPLPARSISLPTPTKPQLPDRVSAKAADRLGISFSELAVVASNSHSTPNPHGSTTPKQPSAAASPVSSPKRTPSFRSVVTKPTVSNEAQQQATQSPGMILWPNTFIQMTPMELEMHACKHIQTLLGCKVAMAEYIGGFFDEVEDVLVTEGSEKKETKKVKVVKDEEFETAFWRYECFRRRRFHWPTEMPDTEFVKKKPSSQSHHPTSMPSPPVPHRFHTFPSTSPSPTSSHHPSSTKGSSEFDFSHLVNAKPGRQELTPLRTIRVFEAVKHSPYRGDSSLKPPPR